MLLAQKEKKSEKAIPKKAMCSEIGFKKEIT